MQKSVGIVLALCCFATVSAFGQTRIETENQIIDRLASFVEDPDCTVETLEAVGQFFGRLKGPQNYPSDEEIFALGEDVQSANPIPGQPLPHDSEEVETLLHGLEIKSSFRPVVDNALRGWLVTHRFHFSGIGAGAGFAFGVGLSSQQFFGTAFSPFGKAFSFTARVNIFSVGGIGVMASGGTIDGATVFVEQNTVKAKWVMGHGLVGGHGASLLGGYKTLYGPLPLGSGTLNLGIGGPVVGDFPRTADVWLKIGEPIDDAPRNIEIARQALRIQTSL